MHACMHEYSRGRNASKHEISTCFFVSSTFCRNSIHGPSVRRLETLHSRPQNKQPRLERHHRHFVGPPGTRRGKHASLQIKSVVVYLRELTAGWLGAWVSECVTERTSMNTNTRTCRHDARVNTKLLLLSGTNVPCPATILTRDTCCTGSTQISSCSVSELSCLYEVIRCFQWNSEINHLHGGSYAHLQTPRGLSLTHHQYFAI